MGSDFVEICPAYMASTTAVSAKVPHSLYTYIPLYTCNTTSKDRKGALEYLLPLGWWE